MKPVPFFIVLLIVVAAVLRVPMSQAETFIEPCSIKGGDCSGGVVGDCNRTSEYKDFTTQTCCEDLDGDGKKHVTQSKYNRYFMTQVCPAPNPSYIEWYCYTRTHIQAVVIDNRNVECDTL